MSIQFEQIEVFSEDGLVKVDLDYIGEGFSGDYDENDPQDVPLLRFGVSRKFTKQDVLKAKNDETFFEELQHLVGCFTDNFEVGWMDIEDSSYCTQLSALAPREHLIEAAQFILSYVESGARDLKRQKKLFEALSWVGLKDNVPYCEYGLVLVNS